MAEVAAKDRLYPSLLDRLTDEEPVPGIGELSARRMGLIQRDQNHLVLGAVAGDIHRPTCRSVVDRQSRRHVQVCDRKDRRRGSDVIHR